MSRKASIRRHILLYAALIAALYALSVTVLGYGLPLSACYAEQWRTFYWDLHWVTYICQSEGLLSLLDSFLMQFAHSTWTLAVPLSVACVLVAALMGWLLRRKVRLWLATICTWLIALAGTLTANGTFSAPAPDSQYRTVMCLSYHGQWSAVTDYYKTHEVGNLLEQNVLNQAWAERGQLPQHLFDHPCRDVSSLVVLNIESPYVAGHLAEIFWSMGEVAMSRMYAFEANEKMDNFSPRMLQRLVLTNIVYGEYAVADKYLRWLEQTLFYRDWARQYRRYLWDDAAVCADPVLGPKRRCIPMENGFPSVQSLAYDLEQIVQSNPGHTVSAQYLEALKRIYHVQ